MKYTTMVSPLAAVRPCLCLRSCCRNSLRVKKLQVVENNLFKKTQLQTSFSGNMLALGSDGTKVIQGADGPRPRAIRRPP